MEYKSMRELHSRRRNKAAAPIGALVLVLAAAGLVALIWLGINLTSQILDDSKEKEKFEKIIQPVLMFDPPAFQDVTTLTNTTVLESALWATMLGDKRETYTYDAQGSLIVPASDVDVTSAKLFGPELQLEHQSFSSDFGISYEYSSSGKAYHIPVMSATALYTPRVDEIERDGDIYSLLVGYIPPGTAWNTDISGKKTEPDPHKFMIYKLKKVNNYYQLIAIEDPPPEKQVTYGAGAPAQNEIASVPQVDITQGEASQEETGEGLTEDTLSVDGSEETQDTASEESTLEEESTSEDENTSGDEDTSEEESASEDEGSSSEEESTGE